MNVFTLEPIKQMKVGRRIMVSVYLILAMQRLGRIDDFMFCRWEKLRKH